MKKIVVIFFVFIVGDSLAQNDSILMARIDSLMYMINVEVIPYIQDKSTEKNQDLETELREYLIISKQLKKENDVFKLQAIDLEKSLAKSQSDHQSLVNRNELIDLGLQQLKQQVESQIKALNNQDYNLDPLILENIENNAKTLQDLGYTVTNYNQLKDFKIKRNELLKAEGIIQVKLTSLNEIKSMNESLEKVFSSGISFSKLNESKNIYSNLLSNYAELICDLNFVFHTVCNDMKIFSESERKKFLIENVDILLYHEYEYLIQMIEKCYKNPKVHPMIHLIKSDC